jgi:hypothetical protein
MESQKTLSAWIPCPRVGPQDSSSIVIPIPIINPDQTNLQYSNSAKRLRAQILLNLQDASRSKIVGNSRSDHFI